MSRQSDSNNIGIFIASAFAGAMFMLGMHSCTAHFARINDIENDVRDVKENLHFIDKWANKHSEDEDCDYLSDDRFTAIDCDQEIRGNVF